MKLIAHRGNINGPNSLQENNPKYIDHAINCGYDVEIDVRYNSDSFYLGHDESQYCISIDWLLERKDSLWIHCKDLNSLNTFSKLSESFNYFWHQNDDFTLTSKRYIWTYPGKPFGCSSVIVMPEANIPVEQLRTILQYECFGVCSNYVWKLV